MTAEQTINQKLVSTGENLNFGDRILLILENQQRTKAWLAEQIGISKQAFNYLLNHTSTPKYINEIAAILEVNPEWLKTGNGSITIDIANRTDIIWLSLIKLRDVKQFIADAQKVNKDTIAVESTLSSHCYAVLLENKSMEPLFLQGSHLIIDPTKTPKCGDYIIFALNDEVYFRQYFIDGNDIYLKTIDTMYKTFSNQKIKIYGVLVESRNSFK
jgi:SOS-response transcriptional repressor LexA